MNAELTTDSGVSLLVVEKSPNQAEKFVTALRSAGIPVHPTRLADTSELDERLAGKAFDLILCSCRSKRPSSQNLSEARASCPDTPLILIYGDEDRETLLDAVRGGARDIVHKDDLAHLQLVVTRELETLQLRRDLAEVGRKLEEAENRCESVMAAAEEAIAYVHDGMHVAANRAYLDMLGYADQEEVEGLPLLDMVDPEFHKQLKKLLKTVERTRDPAPQKMEATCHTSAGQGFSAVLELSPAIFDDEPCTQVHVSAQQSAMDLEAELARVNTVDPDTGLHNRKYFLELIADEQPALAARRESRVLLYVMLDHFQELRNTAGVATSDGLIKEVAGLLDRVRNPDDILARFGDHSFVILVRSVKRPEVEGLAQSVCLAIEEHNYQASEKFIAPTCSIGIVDSNDIPDFDSQRFVDLAYQAAHQASENGGNRFQFFQPEKPSVERALAGSDAVNLEQVIQHAVEENRFRLVYQPILSLHGDPRENYAVMVRMLDESDNEHLPGNFLQKAEAAGLAATIDRWVIRSAILELAHQRDEGKDAHFFISISGQSLSDDRTFPWIRDCMEEFGLKGDALTFQVPEESVRKQVHAAREVVKQLHSIGCGFALDQFGTLPKPESLLKQIHVNFVRLHVSFMDGIAKDHAKQESMKAVCELAASMKVKTVATGVEDANTLAILWNVGVNYIQGYFVQEPSESIAYDFSGAA